MLRLRESLSRSDMLKTIRLLPPIGSASRITVDASRRQFVPISSELISAFASSFAPAATVNIRASKLSTALSQHSISVARRAFRLQPHHSAIEKCSMAYRNSTTRFGGSRKLLSSEQSQHETPHRPGVSPVLKNNSSSCILSFARSCKWRRNAIALRRRERQTPRSMEVASDVSHLQR